MESLQLKNHYEQLLTLERLKFNFNLKIILFTIISATLSFLLQQYLVLILLILVSLIVFNEMLQNGISIKYYKVLSNSFN